MSTEAPKENSSETSETATPETNLENTVESETDKLVCKGEQLSFKMVWNKKSYDMVKLGKENTVGEMRRYIEELTGIPRDMQKIMYKGKKFFCLHIFEPISFPNPSYPLTQQESHKSFNLRH